MLASAQGTIQREVSKKPACPWAMIQAADLCILDEHVRASHIVNEQSTYMLAITKVADLCIVKGMSEQVTR